MKRVKVIKTSEETMTPERLSKYHIGALLGAEFFVFETSHEAVVWGGEIMNKTVYIVERWIDWEGSGGIEFASLDEERACIVWERLEEKNTSTCEHYEITPIILDQEPR